MMDYAAVVVGFALGPAVLLFGHELQAVKQLLNVWYAVGASLLLRNLQDLGSWTDLSPALGAELYSTGLAFAAVLYASMQGGHIDMILRVGVTCNQLTRLVFGVAVQFGADIAWLSINPGEHEVRQHTP